jgi:hypothetical protein
LWGPRNPSERAGQLTPPPSAELQRPQHWHKPRPLPQQHAGEQRTGSAQRQPTISPARLEHMALHSRTAKKSPARRSAPSSTNRPRLGRQASSQRAPSGYASLPQPSCSPSGACRCQPPNGSPPNGGSQHSLGGLQRSRARGAGIDRARHAANAPGIRGCANSPGLGRQASSQRVPSGCASLSHLESTDQELALTQNLHVT